MKKLIVILAAIALVGVFALPATAADWNFYGSARMATFYSTVDDGVSGTDDVKDMSWDQQGNSRIGANVKFNDEIGGRFEMSDSFGKRLLYGTYNFGAGQLLLGQAYTPTTYFYSNSVYDGDGDLLGVGQFYEGRQQMIQLKMAGFKVALIKPNVGSTLSTGSTAPVYPDDGALFVDGVGPVAATSTTTERMLPKIEVSYGFKTDQFFVDVFGGYQTYEEKGTAIGDEDVDSYVVGLGGGANFGPVFFKAGVHMSQNQGQYGAYNPADMSDEAVISGTELVDNDGMGYLAVLGFKASDSMTIEVGYGYEENELDTSGSNADETAQYYANLTYVITPGFFIVPEIGMIDYEDDVEKGDLTYFGLKWQINF